MCANFSGIGINLFCQVILVPFYIEQWGVDKYADWIVLSSVSSVFSMSDIGLNTVISNQFSIKMAQGDEQYCRSLLTDNYFLLLIVSLFGIIGCLVFVNICDVNSLLGLSVLSSENNTCCFTIVGYSNFCINDRRSFQCCLSFKVVNF